MIDMEVFRVWRLGRDATLLSGSAVMEIVQYGQRRVLDNLFIMTWTRMTEGMGSFIVAVDSRKCLIRRAARKRRISQL